MASGLQTGSGESHSEELDEDDDVEHDEGDGGKDLKTVS